MEAELTKANRICSLSRVKWLGALDEPNKVFFAILKAKQLREEMNTLITNARDHIKDEGGILHEVQRFYYKLFQIHGNNNEATTVRKELQHTTIAITQAQRDEIERLPMEEELRAILNKMPREKLLGLDGMIVEVLLAC